MNYTSTRDASVKVSSAMAISQGISEDGGLFVPEFIPKLSDADFAKISSWIISDAPKRCSSCILPILPRTSLITV